VSFPPADYYPELKSITRVACIENIWL